MVGSLVVACSSGDDSDADSVTTDQDSDTDSTEPGAGDESGDATVATPDSSDPGDDAEVTVEPTVGPVPSTSTPPTCEAEVVEVATDWPFVVAGGIDPTETVVDGLDYVVRGLTNLPEQVLVDTMEQSFDGFDVDEPAGGVSDVTVDFATQVGDVARLDMADDDGDGCWDVEITATFVVTPDPALDDASDGQTSAEADAEALFNDAIAVGSGEIVTAGGTFQLAVTSCEIHPLAVEAIAREGQLVLSSAADDAPIEVTWTYADGTEVTADEAIVLARTEDGGAFVGNGESDDGPESLIIEFSCEQ